jgi:hypothetical protein
MPRLPLVFQKCRPRPEVLAGELPDAIFAADLWDVIKGKAHPDYQDPQRFFQGTHPTENLKLLVKDVSERLAGVEGSTPIFRLETGFGGGKTHGLIAAVHVARHGQSIANFVSDYRINRFPFPDDVRVAAFVGEVADPSSGYEHLVDGQPVRTFTPWGQIALMAGGLIGYHLVRENDIQGIAPERETLEKALGDKPVLILIDELVLYMARGFAISEDHPRHKVNTQWPTFLQSLFNIAARRPCTSVILTLPSEQDANRRFTTELKQYVTDVLELVSEAQQTAGRHAPSLTPTQTYERASVLGRRLFESIDTTAAADIANAYAAYYQEQLQAGVELDSRALEPGYMDQMRTSYPFHPEFVRLFAERLADIPEFQATRGALRLVARTIRGAWDKRDSLPDAFLLQPQHIDLSRSDIRDEILARLGRSAFGRGLEADVVRPEGGTHANQVESGWPWKAATESSLVVFLHSLPDGSRGITPPEAALAVGRPGCDLAYVRRALEDTERRAWYMRQEGDHYLFRTRASINKRFQERLANVQPPEVRETLDQWIQEVYSGFGSFQVIPFPQDHNAISDTVDRLRLVIVHYDTECGAIGGGDRLNFVKGLFMKTGAYESPRRYRNNIVFLLAENTRVTGLKEAVRALIAWERVRKDIETEQSNLALTQGSDYRTLKDLARRGATGVPAEFMALESDLGDVREKLGTQELHVRSKLLEAYRVLAFPRGRREGQLNLFEHYEQGPLLECYRVDLGERPDGDRPRNLKQAVPEAPILQCLRDNNKLVPEARPGTPVVLAPQIVRRPPFWKESEKRVSTDDVWDRLRSEPELPMVLKQTDLLPTFRAGLTTEPEALWVYYNQTEKKVYNRENADALSPVIDSAHFLYDVRASVTDRILPVTAVSPQEIWDHLWPREGAERTPSVTTAKLLEMARASRHFPVIPGNDVLWRGLQEGAHENRWVLYLRGPNLAIGSQEMMEWPGTPRIDEVTELWSYQAALDQNLYPRQVQGVSTAIPLTAAAVRERCWPSGADQVPTENIERFARNVWPDVTRPRLEMILSDGLREGLWAVLKTEPEDVLYTKDDTPHPPIRIAPSWSLIEPASALVVDLDGVRPGKGPQPVTRAGTPREVFVQLWDELGAFRDVYVRELSITATDRDALDNTLFATWADRPATAVCHASLTAAGQREIQGKQETASLSFEGRFEEVRAILSPLWPFKRQGDLEMTITVSLRFDPTIPLGNPSLETYRTALMNANQGTIEANVIPARVRGQRGA